MARTAVPTQAVLEALPLAYAVIKARQVSGSGASAVWTPQEGPQRAAYESPADETLFGGSPGGGKTDWLLGLALTQHRRAVIFRREFAQVGAMIDRAVEIVGNDDGLNRSNSTWRFTDGRFVEWGGVQHERDTLSKWRGRAHDLKAFDELTEFSETQYLTLSGWARTAVPGQRVRVVGTCNPPESEDSAWIIKRWGPWVDPTHKDPAASGEVRWYAVIDGTDTECEDGQPFDWKGETIRPRSRTFVRSWLSDNRYLRDTGYAAVIDALPEPLRSIMKSGDFTAAMNTVNPMQVIPSAWVRAAQARWTPDRPEDREGRPVPQSCVAADVAQGGADRTVLACRYGDWLDRLIVKPGRETPTANDVARLVEAELVRGGYAVVDCDGVGGEAYGVLLSRHANKARAYRGVKPTFWRDQAAVLDFLNCLTGDARVRPVGKLRRIYRSRYDGPLYRVKMASGDEFTATANHNVLTLRGWVAVQTLSVGDQLCNAGGAERAHPGNPEEHDVPPKLSEVYGSACARFGAQRVADSAVDFHGDRPVGEVEVVTVHGELWGTVPAIREHVQHEDLIRHLTGERALSRQSGAALAGMAGNRQGRGVVRLRPGFGPDRLSSGVLLSGETLGRESIGVGICSQGHAALQEDANDGALRHPKISGQRLDRFARSVARFDQDAVKGEGWQEGKRFSLAPWVDAAFSQDATHNVPIDPVTLGERVRGLAPQIASDEVVSIDITPLEQHGGSFVYTLETSTGAYTSQSVAHRNCRAAAWWALREALDPKNNRPIALPPDPELRAELCSARWEWKGQKIKLEDKDDIISRLGRSPDCLIAGTKVRTPNGERNIEDIGVLDVVETPWGDARVIRTHSVPASTLVTLTLVDGRTLTGKPDHAVFTFERGWVKLVDLQVSDTVSLASWTTRTLWRLLGRLCSTAERTGFKRVVKGVATTSRGRRDAGSAHPILPCTGTSTHRRMDPSRTATTSTTSTTTRSTTTRATLLPCAQEPITQGTCRTASPILSTGRATRQDLTRFASAPPSGIGLPRGLRGIASMLWGSGPRTSGRGELRKWPASNVERRLSPITRMLATAPTPAFSVLSTTLAATSRWSGPARIAAWCLSRTGTSQGSRVRDVVLHTSARPRLVYDLTLERHNAYWANGVLVENCADAVVMAFWPGSAAELVESYGVKVGTD